MASTATKIVPDSVSKAMGGLDISILSLECEERVYGAQYPASKAGHPQNLSYGALSSKAVRAPKECSMYSLDVNSDSCSSSTSSRKGRLSMVLEESESVSHREGSSTSWDTSFTSSLSSSKSTASSTASSTRPLVRRNKRQKPRKPQKIVKRRNDKETSFASMLLWPLKKVRDGYMSCIMGLDGTGDLSGLAQGATFATTTKFFADLPESKIDARNFG